MGKAEKIQGDWPNAGNHWKPMVNCKFGTRGFAESPRKLIYEGPHTVDLPGSIATIHKPEMLINVDK